MLKKKQKKKTAWCPRLTSSNSCFHDDKQALTTSSYSYSHSVIVPAACYHGNRAAKVCMIKSPVCCYSYRSLAGIQVSHQTWRYLFFGCNGQFVACYEAADLLHAQIEKLLTLHDLWEVLLCECQWVGERLRLLNRVTDTIVTLVYFSLVWMDGHTPAYVLARLSSSVQACKSAKARIPRQLVGWSWVMRNSQQAFLTSCNCSRPAAGKST